MTSLRTPLTPPLTEVFCVVCLASTAFGCLKVLQLFLIPFHCGVLVFQTLHGLLLDLFLTYLLAFWLAASKLKPCLCLTPVVHHAAFLSGP